MSRRSPDVSARLVALATAAVTIAGIALVGFAVAEGRGSGSLGDAIVCAIVGGDDAGSLSGRRAGPGC